MPEPDLLKSDGDSPHQLVVNADDFGRSSSINRAVVRAHREGILTTASLMVAEDACEEAVEMARDLPELGVGLHVSLVCGKLLRERSLESDSPVLAGCRFFFNRELEARIRSEIEAQFERLSETGLTLDHVNGHLNIHLHPVVLPIILEVAESYGQPAIRLTRDPLLPNLRLGKGRWGYRLSHAMIFGGLSAIAEGELVQRGLPYADRVYGLLQSGEMNEGYVAGLLRELPEGCSEMYFHPDKGNVDLSALTSVQARDAIQQRGIKMIRYQDLA